MEGSFVSINSLICVKAAGIAACYVASVKSNEVAVVDVRDEMPFSQVMPAVEALKPKDHGRARVGMDQ
jgi:hypothetical protein